MNEYNNKHAFLSESSSPHTLNLLLNLINKEILKKSDIVLVLYGSTLPDNGILQKARIFNIEVLDWDEIKNSSIQFLSLNPFSLFSFNAGIINHCIKKGFVSSANINFLMQDDEIDRWNKIYNKQGKLVEAETAFVDANVISILKKVDTYIVPYNPWGKTLEKVVGRKLKIVDAVVPFSVIDYESEKIFDKFLEVRKINLIKKNNYKVLLYTKPVSYEVMVKAYIALINVILQNKLESTSENITISIWYSTSRKLRLMYAFLMALTSSRKSKISIELKKPMTHEQYLLMLHEHDCLLLQTRGGFSTAKYFAEKVGKIITLKGSFNDQSLQQDYGINTFNYENIEDALIAAISSADLEQISEIKEFSSKMTQRHNKSYSILKNFWASI